MTIKHFDDSSSNPLKNFEKNCDTLSKIEKKLESPKISLEESLELFEEAQNLIKQCQKALNQAELKIKTIRDQSDFDSIE